MPFPRRSSRRLCWNQDYENISETISQLQSDKTLSEKPLICSLQSFEVKCQHRRYSTSLLPFRTERSREMSYRVFSKHRKRRCVCFLRALKRSTPAVPAATGAARSISQPQPRFFAPQPAYRQQSTAIARLPASAAVPTCLKRLACTLSFRRSRPRKSWKRPDSYFCSHGVIIPLSDMRVRRAKRSAKKPTSISWGPCSIPRRRHIGCMASLILVWRVCSATISWIRA